MNELINVCNIFEIYNLSLFTACYVMVCYLLKSRNTASATCLSVYRVAHPHNWNTCSPLCIWRACKLADSSSVAAAACAVVSALATLLGRR